jgi:pyruvate dehydrogenase E2 component (dihydrolipoamide acetyltransferase)
MDVKLPSLGEGADSGVVVSVLVKEGDTVQNGQTILELENEKAVAPIPATAAGRVTKIFVKAGDKISVGAKILSIGEGGGSEKSEAAAKESPASQAKAAPAKRAPAPEPEPEVEDVSDADAADDEAPDGPVPAASPGVRKIAHELGIDLRRVRGSEPGGRVVMGDLRAYIQRLVQQARAKKAAPAAAQPARVPESVDFSQWGEVTKKPLSQLRKVIARRMGESSTQVARVTQFDEVDITGLLDLRKQFNDAYKAKGANLTVTCFALKALAQVLKKHPIFNASLDEAAQEIVFKEYVHIGIAVDTEQGLLVPVIRNVDKKSLLDLAKELGSLAERARDRKITADEMKGGTFTISNQGAIGGGHFTPIVNLPEVAILGMGKGALKPAVINGKIEARTLMPVTLSYDHRLIDGGAAARFTVDLLAAMTAFTAAEVKL